jgi:hypothetical protein
MFEEMLVASRDSLSDLASSNDGEDREDENDEETEQCTQSEDDAPCRVMGTISITVQQRMERFRLKQMKLDELTQLGWEDGADYFRERDKKHSTSELMVPVIFQLLTNDDTTAPALTTF